MEFLDTDGQASTGPSDIVIVDKDQKTEVVIGVAVPSDSNFKDMRS